jgi:hypothetical protein
MTPETRIIIDNRFTHGGEYKKYRSTQEQIQQNQREKLVQRERDERARNEANRNGNNGNTNSAQNR